LFVFGYFQKSKGLGATGGNLFGGSYCFECDRIHAGVFGEYVVADVRSIDRPRPTHFRSPANGLANLGLYDLGLYFIAIGFLNS